MSPSPGTARSGVQRLPTTKSLSCTWREHVGARGDACPTEVAFGEARVDLHAQADARGVGRGRRRRRATCRSSDRGARGPVCSTVITTPDAAAALATGASASREPRRGVVPVDPERRSGGEHEASPELGGRVHRATEALLLRSPCRRCGEVPPAELDDVADAHARARRFARPHDRGPPPRASGRRGRRGRCRPPARTPGPRRASSASSTPR